MDAGCGGHGAWFLEVVEAGLVVGASGGADILAVEVGVFDPGDGGDGKWGEFFEGFAGDFGGVQAEAVGAGGVEAGEEGRVFGAEEVLHAGEEGWVKLGCGFVHDYMFLFC